MTSSDLAILRKALKAQDGPVSLGRLRREHGLDPSQVLRLVAAHPDSFVETTEIEKGRQTPAVQLGSELSPQEQKFIRAVRGGGVRGCYESSLHRTLKLSARAQAQMAEKFSHLVGAEKRQRKVCYLWRGGERLCKNLHRRSEQAGGDDVCEIYQTSEKGPETAQEDVSSIPEPESPSDASTGVLEPIAGQSEPPETAQKLGRDELSVLADRLKRFLSDGSTRELGFVVTYLGLSERAILQVIQANPGTFELEEVNLSRMPEGAHIKIGLVRPTLDESHVQEPTPSLQTPLSEVLSPEELAIATWRPPAPGQCTRRGGTVLRDGRYRVRRPLVEIE